MTEIFEHKLAGLNIIICLSPKIEVKLKFFANFISCGQLKLTMKILMSYNS